MENYRNSSDNAIRYMNNNNNNSNNTNGKNDNNTPLTPEPSIEVIKQALIALYKSQDNSIRDTAHHWLMKFQTLPIAWEFAPKLIYDDILEVQFFGASTLELKLKNDWRYQTKEVRANILKVIVDIVQGSAKLPKLVITRVCVALSIVVMYTYPDVWPNAIIDVIQLSCQNIKSISLSSPEQNLYDFNRLYIVLEFLSQLAHELKQQNISAQHKVLLGEIKKIIDLIYQYLLSILLLPMSKYKDEIKLSFNAISKWIKYLLPSASMLKNVFHICFKVAMINPGDYIDNLVVVLEGSTCTLEKQVQTSNNSREAEEAYRFAVEHSLSTLPIYFKEAIDQNDWNKAKLIFNLFVQFMQCNNENVFCKEILTQHLDLLLKFIQIGDIEINSLVFPLLDEFKHIKGIQSLDKQLVHIFLIKTFDRFLELSMLPMNFQPNDKEDHELSQFRYATTESFSHILCIEALPKSTLHKHLLGKLEDSIKKGVNIWQIYEAILYYLTSLSDSVSVDGTEIITQLLGLLPMIPVKTLPLIRCSIRLVSKYPFYLKDKPEYLNKVVFDLIPAFGETDLLNDAGSSFTQICANTHCSGHLLPHIDKIIDLCQLSLSKQQNNQAIIPVYEGLLRIAQNITSSKDLAVIFEKLIVPIINNLKLIIQSNNIKDKEFLKIQLQILESVSKIIDDSDTCQINNNGNGNNNGNNSSNNGNTNGNNNEEILRLQHEKKVSHPLYELLTVMIPILGHFLSTYRNDLEVVDLIAKPYRWLLMYSKSISFDFLLPILQQITNAFSVSPFPSLLQVLHSIVSQTGLKPDQEHELRDSITRISQVTLNIFKLGVNAIPTAILHSSKGNQFQEAFDPQYLTNFSINPDLTNHYLSMISLCYKKNPQCLDPNVINTLIIYIIYNLLDCTNHHTTRNCWNFLSTVILANKSNIEYIKTQISPLVDSTIIQHAGRVLARNLLIGMTSAIPTSLLQWVADVSLNFCTAYSKIFRQEASKLLHHPDFPNTSVDLGDKQKFLSELQRVNDPVEYRYSIRTFAILCGTNQK